jgi:hypothetical protein
MTHRNSDEPNLFNNSISLDHIRNKSRDLDNEKNEEEQYDTKVTNDKGIMEQIMKNLDNLQATDTDMMFENFANPDKLVSADKIVYFEKDRNPPEQKPSQSEFKPKYSESPESDRRSESEEPKSDPLKASAYGPSYGDGPSVANISTSNDKYSGFESEEELNLAKLSMLRDLCELVQHGVKLSQNYHMNSDYKAMKYERDLHRSIKDKHNGVKWMNKLMCHMCYGVELANDNFNPFEFKLKGWSEQVEDDSMEYYDVLGELYEKYFKAGKPIPPELKLAFLLASSAASFHVSKTLIAPIPPLNEALAQDPELFKRLNEQAISDKIKSQYEKQRESYGKKAEEQHNIAEARARDLKILKEQQDEYLYQQQNNFKDQQKQFMHQQMMQQQLMQQQIADKQRQLDELEQQLALRSDTKSMYTTGNNSNNYTPKQNYNYPPPSNYKTDHSPPQQTMQMPNIPSRVKSRFSVVSKTKSPPVNKTQQQNYKYDGITDAEADNIINISFGDNVSQDSNRSTKSNKSVKSARRATKIKIDT